MNIELADRVAIVTGGGGGIGAGIARVLHRCGARIALVDIANDAAERVANDIGESVIACSCDISNQIEVQQAVDEIVRHWGRLDILVNCASLPPTLGKFLDQDNDQWIKATMVNQLGTVNMCRIVGKLFVEQGSGAVINISSISGIRPGTVGNEYSMSKSAQITLSNSLAVQWAPFGVRVNTIAPGAINAGMFAGMFADTKKNEARIKHNVNTSSPLGTGSSEDIGCLTAFLASDLSGFITGTVIPVDGGALSVR